MNHPYFAELNSIERVERSLSPPSPALKSRSPHPTEKEEDQRSVKQGNTRNNINFPEIHAAKAELPAVR